MILVQPQAAHGEAYEAFANKEGLCFELLELSLPSSMDSPSPEKLIAPFRGKPVESIHGAFIDLNAASADPKIRAISRERCHQSCRLAKELGAGRVVFHGGFTPYLRDPAYQSAWAEHSAEFYLELIRTYDLSLYIENFADQNPNMLLKLMEAGRHPRLRVCLDVGHTHFTGTPTEEWFQVLRKYIGYLHLSDNRGQYDEHLAIGTGTIDWAEMDRLCRALRDFLAPIDLPVTLELTGIERQAESIRFLREKGYFPY